LPTATVTATPTAPPGPTFTATPTQTPELTNKVDSEGKPSLTSEAATNQSKKPVKIAQPAANSSQAATQPGSAPEPGMTQRGSLANSTSTFALDLYQQLRAKKENLAYSPYSISLAAAMAYAGARGETERQMASTFHFPLPQDPLHAAFGALHHELAMRGRKPAQPASEATPFRLNIANAVWGQDGYDLLPGYLDLLNRYYGAGLGLLDFATAPEASRNIINDWCREETEGRIPKLLRPGTVNSATRLVLTNAIYFNAAWRQPFDPDRTTSEAFHLLDGRSILVPMMKQKAKHDYVLGQGFQAVILPYAGGEISMWVVVPDSGRFNVFEDSLVASQVDAIVAQKSWGLVNLTMPKFEVDTYYSLKETLSILGMPLAFDLRANFSGITGHRKLFIQDVVHQAFVSINEKGTEAAAATGIAIAPGMPRTPPVPVEIRIDRPFVFFIRDVETGTILFVGRVLDPSG
jgi:serpin B